MFFQPHVRYIHAMAQPTLTDGEIEQTRERASSWLTCIEGWLLEAERGDEEIDTYQHMRVTLEQLFGPYST